MTITKHDRIALIPTRCDKCNRLFIFEPYDFYYKEVGIDHHSLKQVKCIECVKRFEQRKVVAYSPNQMHPDTHGGFTYANQEKEE